MLIKFFKDETGLELSEYAVVAAFIVVATVIQPSE
jgi:Flp pilus assembly pilin Flp